MDKCQCTAPGFCDFFKQEMTSSPPNWQWCQGTTPQDRERYKIACDKKHERREAFFSGIGEYITTSQMIKDCRDLLLPKVAHLDLKGVLGIPRSGVLPASMIAMWLNLPLYSLDSSGKPFVLSGVSSFGGGRMDDFISNNGRLLVVDDTIYSGTAMKDIKNKILQDAFYCCVYFRNKSKFKPDFFGKELSPPHLLEWNLFNSTYIQDALLDFDGILSPNVPHDICLDEEKYIEYITNVKPLPHRMPKGKCKGIVTARLEKYREVTEQWLDKHKIEYGFLKMFPTEREQERDKNHTEEAATFKSDIFISSDASFFIESEIAEAAIIRRRSGKFVVCPQD